MGHVSASNPYGAGNKAVNAIDRKRERERRYMFKRAYEIADELALHLVQRLLDKNIIETDSTDAVRRSVSNELQKLQDMEDFDLQFKIAPLRQLTSDPNFLSLYMTQYIIEDLINHPRIDDVYGDDIDIYKVVDSILDRIRPSE
ncbi:MAG: hypothetical protein ACQES8_00515 [Thermodesulfobacteriota bacterium]